MTVGTSRKSYQDVIQDQLKDATNLKEGYTREFESARKKGKCEWAEECLFWISVYSNTIARFKGDLEL